jgi:putative sigma-54 modulation protein
MRLELTGRHLEIAAPVRRLVERKLARLERMLNDSALSAQVVLSREKRVYRADVSLHARGEKFLHGVGESAAWESSMTQAVAKIVQQASRVKGKWQARKRPGRGATLETPADDAATPPRQSRSAATVPKSRLLQATRHKLKSMSLSQATREIEAGGDGLVVYRDADTATVSVLYKRGNGELTLIETDV